MNVKLTVIGGAGTMGKAIVQGIISKGLVQPCDITVTARHDASLAPMKDLGVNTTKDNQEAINGADIVMIAVHPKECVPVLKELEFSSDQILVSIVSGIPIKTMSRAVGKDLPIVRAMPNVAALVGQSMTALCHGDRLSDEMLDKVTGLFKAVGEVVLIDESLSDAATGLAGCGPAFVFKVIEALASGGIKMGLPRAVSHKMAAQVVRGSGELVVRTGKHPAALIDEVTSPGGCTIDGLTKLEEHGMPFAILGAVETATLKAGILARGPSDPELQK